MDEQDDKELREITRSRSVRHTIYEGSAYPFGEKKINPQKIEGAAEYGSWLRKRPSWSMEQLAHHDMLKHEEDVLAGRVFHDRRPVTPRVEQSAPLETPEAPRTNRLSAVCATCQQSVAPGEGIVKRTPDGYVTNHRNH